MLWWVLRSVRPLVGCCLVALLFGGGAITAVAQSTMDPNIDSDGDGTANNMDFDDDNDGIADNLDCAPFDPAYGLECPTLPPPPDPTPDPPPSPIDPTPTSPDPTPPLPNPTPTPEVNANPDNDDDGIEDRFDPDDDNDGISDDQDSAPFDPNVGVAPTPSIIDSDADNDGDGIENSHDPDDDNDGVADDEDSHPFDPTKGEKPPPSIIDPNEDSDGDGIANSHDPDDDNDGVLDEVDCAPFDPAVSDCSESDDPVDPPGNGGTGATDGGAKSGGTSPLLVTSLPSTGSGDGAAFVSDAGKVWITLAGAMTVLVVLAIPLLRRRNPR